MENAQLIGLSRQIALQRQMDVVANNIANINTTGFKSEQTLFEEYLMPVARDRDFGALDQQLSYTDDWTTIHDMSGGALVQTGNPLDVALQGEGFLTVQTPQGNRYTRSGSLAIDASGFLVDLNGNQVLSTTGPIHFGASETDIAIGEDGSISSSAGAKGQLQLVEFTDPQAVERQGDSLWSGGNPIAATSTRVIQGAIEKSNVSGVGEMTEMIRVQRAYESVASLLSEQNDQRRSAIQKLGNLNA
ncbi:MAG: Flagellar basal-body rod protein FlgF [Devosia sp.]|uniref:flagellar basal-body rod protein FlgF n=1 Tax=Devosia sp. TaxID=1871048 RepID=UPI00262CC699|nr:flagellar basal-body rod protein FlgF [Devosia sp.]MDB5542041.1 Flagellar basal-body rod protein FlgF [Devosia sp.]